MARKSRRCDKCCVIDSDQLDDPDSDNPGAKWDEAGTADYDLSGGSLLVANSSGGGYILMFTTPHPGGAAAPVEVSVEFMLDDLADSAGFVVSVDSAANPAMYLQGSVNSTPGCATIDLADEGVLISSTNHVPGLTANQWHKMKLCYFPGDGDYDPGILRMRVDLANGRVYGDQLLNDYHQSLNTDGPYVGLIGDPGVRFRNFQMKWARDPNAYFQDCKQSCSDCNTPCLIEEDAFTFDDPCKWLVISGSWVRDLAGSLEAKCLSAGIMLCAVHHPQDKTSHYVTCDVWAAIAVKGRVLVNAKADGSSYHWAELSMDANGTTLTLKIGKAGATLAQVTASGVSAFYTITVCFDQGVLTAAGAGMSVFAASAEVASGTYAGLAGVLGGERFRNFRFEKHRSFSDPADRDCEHCEELVVCDGCKDSQAPAYWLVEVSGFGNGTCSECTRAEEVTTGSFLLFNAGVFNPCGWEMFTLQGSDYYICCHGTMPTSCSGTSPCGFESWFAFADISLQITRNYNGTGKTRALCTLGFGASFGSCSQTVEYEKLVPDDTLDCMDANGIELDLSTINVPSCGSAPNDLIDASASRVRIYPA